MSRKIFRIFVFLAAVESIVLNMYDYPHFAELFSYFTIISNVLCMILFTIALFKEPTPFFRGLVTACITITFLVYHTMLRSPDLTWQNLGRIKVLSTVFAHYIVPVFALADYLFFCKKGNMKKSYPLKWLAFPICYLCYLPVYANLGGTFIVNGKVSKVPYFFLDASQVGNAGVVFWCIAVAAGFLMISYLLVFTDKLLSKY